MTGDEEISKAIMSGKLKRRYTSRKQEYNKTIDEAKTLLADAEKEREERKKVITEANEQDVKILDSESKFTQAEAQVQNFSDQTEGFSQHVQVIEQVIRKTFENLGTKDVGVFRDGIFKRCQHYFSKPITNIDTLSNLVTSMSKKYKPLMKEGDFLDGMSAFFVNQFNGIRKHVFIKPALKDMPKKGEPTEELRTKLTDQIGEIAEEVCKEIFPAPNQYSIN